MATLNHVSSLRNAPKRSQGGQQKEREKEQEVGHGGGKFSMNAIADSVDKVLDESHRFKGAVRAAFERFQLPSPATQLPVDQLLPALQYFIQKIVEDLDPKAGKLVLRPLTQDDVDSAVHSDSSLSLDVELIGAQQFERFAREVIKRVALDRGKRLGLFMIGGILVVHMTKNAVKRIPLLGAPIGAFVNVLVPTTLLGPAVGLAGALYL